MFFNYSAFCSRLIVSLSFFSLAVFSFGQYTVEYSTEVVGQCSRRVFWLVDEEGIVSGFDDCLHAVWVGTYDTDSKLLRISQFP